MTKNILLVRLINQYIITNKLRIINSECFESYMRFFMEQWKIPFLKKEEIRFEIEVVKLVPTKYILSNGIIPLRMIQNQLIIGIIDIFALNQVINYLGINDYQLVVIEEETLKYIINKVHGNETTKHIIKTLEQQTTFLSKEKGEKMVSLAPIVQLVDSFFNEAINLKASDIHIEPQESKVCLRMRIDGILVEKAIFEIKIYPAILTRIKIMASIDITNKRLPQDGKIRYEHQKIIYDFRVSTLPTIHGEKLVIRILDRYQFNFTRDQLGFSIHDNEKVSKILSSPHGLLLLTGPTGCGKTTTLYSFIEELNDSTRNIVTIEDPVEYTISGVNQVQVHHQINLTFKETIRSLLRQDPDIMMIGEIRDEETAQMAIRSAITGHFVMATLHTNHASSVITRLLDMGIPHYLIAEAVIGVIAQRLVRKVCCYCAYLRPP